MCVYVYVFKKEDSVVYVRAHIQWACGGRGGANGEKKKNKKKTVKHKVKQCDSKKGGRKDESSPHSQRG